MRIYCNDLYHFGIKGMRWGIRKQRPPSSPRQFTRALNRTDQKRARANYQYVSLNSKKKTLNNMLKVNTKGNSRIKKQLKSIRKKERKANSKRYFAAKQSRELVRSALSKGYHVYSKNFTRTANQGEVAVRIVLGATIAPGLDVKPKHIPGVKYKVTRNTF